MILQWRLSNSGFSPAMYPSSVVQTGVKSLGCEKRIAQPSPIHSWKLMVPWVVSAVKFGASLLILSAIDSPRFSKYPSILTQRREEHQRANLFCLFVGLEDTKRIPFCVQEISLPANAR